jgi:hypothetical protein
MDRFLDIYDYPKLSHKHINCLNISIAQNVIETAIKSLPPKKVQDLMDSLLNSIRVLKKNKSHVSVSFSMI